MTEAPWTRDGFKNKSLWLRRHMGAHYSTFGALSELDLNTASPEQIASAVREHAFDAPCEIHADAVMQSARHHRAQGQEDVAQRLEQAARRLAEGQEKETTA